MIHTNKPSTFSRKAIGPLEDPVSSVSPKPEVSDKKKTGQVRIIGTADYIAPEILAGEEP